LTAEPFNDTKYASPGLPGGRRRIEMSVIQEMDRPLWFTEDIEETLAGQSALLVIDPDPAVWRDLLGAFVDFTRETPREAVHFSPRLVRLEPIEDGHERHLVTLREEDMIEYLRSECEFPWEHGSDVLLTLAQFVRDNADKQWECLDGIFVVEASGAITLLRA
jgi:hypothetical protein